MKLWTKLLALWIPFDGTHFHYGNDDPGTPRQMLEATIAAFAITGVIAFLMWAVLP